MQYSAFYPTELIVEFACFRAAFELFIAIIVPHLIHSTIQSVRLLVDISKMSNDEVHPIPLPLPRAIIHQTNHS